MSSFSPKRSDVCGSLTCACHDRDGDGPTVKCGRATFVWLLVVWSECEFGGRESVLEVLRL